MIYLNKNNIFKHHEIFNNRLILIPILSDINLFYIENRISFIYIYDIDNACEYILNFFHNDCYKFKTKILNNSIMNNEYLIYHKEYVTNIFNDAGDLELYYWFKTNNRIKVDESYKNFYTHQYKDIKNVNDFIPLSLHIGYCRNIVKLIVDIYDGIDESFKLYMNVVYNGFKSLEYMGIPWRDHTAGINSVSDRRIYNNFNLYGITGRPSNVYDGINLMGFSDKNDMKQNLVADDFYKLIEFDIDSYHMQLINILMKLNLPRGNLYQYFGRHFYGTPLLSEEQYSYIKKLSFSILYGSAKNNLHPSLNTVKLFRSNLYEFYNKTGYISTPYTKRKMYKSNLGDLPENILFNYFMQSYETEYSAIILNKILKFLTIYNNSRIILYRYDSFLLNVNISDLDAIQNGIITIFKKMDQTVKIKIGNNYAELDRVK